MAPTPDAPRPDTEGSPVHDVTAPTTAWTTHNAAEVMPGVLTPLAASYWITHSEAGLLGGMSDFGVVARRDARLAESPDKRLAGMFYGRYAINVHTLCGVAQRTPGSSGAAVERQFFGEARGLDHGGRGLARYPIVLTKMPYSAVRIRGRLRRTVARMHAWWPTAVAAAAAVSGTADGDLARAQRLLTEAGARMEDALRDHMAVTMLGQAVNEQLVGLAAAAGLPGHELKLTTGFGNMEETRLVVGIWDLGHETLSLADFLAEFGFHGPSEGEVASRSWREDPAPVLALARKYSSLPADRHPLAVEQVQIRAREAAEEQLLAALPAWRRAPAKAVLALARLWIPDRELGKWGFLRGVDGGRAAARAVGRSLVALGVIDEPGDVMYLSYDEVLGDPAALGDPAFGAGGARDLVDRRKQQHKQFELYSLPTVWEGEPVPSLLTDRPADLTSLRGYPASQGIVEGIARVVADADGCDALEEGEILVCPTTDPAWVSAFYIAAALVVDVGGPGSHAAIVARELGVPAVVGTEYGTASIRTGDRLRVDGLAGTVEVVARG